ncbi:hypothetical protein C8Q73DRAFT_482676 [Cubamyces lactineus]|nr:hypothetical protein C8Q73DRAFT_482676 [Cubamyces lactineus]
MFSERVERTIYLESSRCRDELHRVLEQFGEVRGIHAARGVEESAKSPWFIEFSNASGANKALSAAPQGTVVRGLADQPRLADCFRAVAGPDLPPKPQNHDFKSARYSPYPNNKDKRSSARRKDERRSKAVPTFAVLGPASPMSSSRTGARPTTSHERPSWKGHRNKENHPHLHLHEESALFIQSPPHNQAVETSTAGTSSCSSATAAPNTGPLSLVSNDSCHTGCQLERSDVISLSHHGEPVTIHLSDLGDSPEDVIGLLRMTACHALECAKWMMVGAHYRGKGNARAALTVVNAMIEAHSNDACRNGLVVTETCYTIAFKLSSGSRQTTSGGERRGDRRQPVSLRKRL